MNDLVGRTFGRWLVQAPLAHGGRGALYEAHATDVPELRAAIRFIEAPDQAEEVRSRAEYELLRAYTSISVKVYDFGVAEVGGSRIAHLAMELFDRESLAARLQRGALSIGEAAGIGQDVAIALTAVHRAGIAHLDIKPANLLVRGESATLVGFGAAQRVGVRNPGSWERALAYAAPEQLDPDALVTCASDIHALGATLFELLTGRADAASRTRSDALAALRRPGVPADFAQLVAQMLAADPADRPVASDVVRVLMILRADLHPPEGPGRGQVPIAISPGPETGSMLQPQGGPEAAPRSPGPVGGMFGSLGRMFQWLVTPRSHPMPSPLVPDPQRPTPGVFLDDDKSQPATSATVCHRCGNENPDHYKFCLICGTDLTAAPRPGGGGPMTKTMMPDAQPYSAAPAPAPENAGILFWNIGFPGNDAVIASRVLVMGTPYALETALQPARAVHSFSQARVDAKDILRESAEVPVKFVIEARGAAVRAPGSPGWATAVASEGLMCRAGGTDVFQVEVQADAAGPVSITVAFHVRGAITLRETIALHAVGIAGVSPEVTGRADPEPEAIEVSSAAIQAVPEATLVLQLDPYERWYGLKITAGGVEDAAMLHTCATTAELAKEAVLARKKLVALSRRYRTEPARDDDPFAGLRPADHGEALLEIAQIGRRLHALLFGEPEENVPLDLARVADLIRGHGQNAEAAPRMQIDAETLPFPWGIVYDAGGPLDSVADVTLYGFWGRRFVIDRTISAILRSLPPPTLDGAIQPCLNPHLDTEESLDVVARQRGFFERIGRTNPVRRAIESGEQLRAYLTDEGIAAPAILYFFCHARAAHEMSDQLFQIAAAADEQASLMLDPSGSQRELSVGELKKLRKSPLKARPLVFLNACSSAEADQYYQSQFLTLFVSQWQARAFIGSDWKIPTEFADAFARRALDRFLGSDPEAPRLALGAALHATAAEVLELKNPFPLIYALYGRPELQAA